MVLVTAKVRTKVDELQFRMQSTALFSKLEFQERRQCSLYHRGQRFTMLDVDKVCIQIDEQSDPNAVIIARNLSKKIRLKLQLQVIAAGF